METKIEVASNILEIKFLRSERKYPKQVREQLIDLVLRGNSKVESEMGLALMAVNLRKFTAINYENKKRYIKNRER